MREIAIKQAAGKLSGIEDLGTLVDDQGFQPLSITLYHAIRFLVHQERYIALR